jgi:hypothetical protein
LAYSRGLELAIENEFDGGTIDAAIGKNRRAGAGLERKIPRNLPESSAAPTRRSAWITGTIGRTAAPAATVVSMVTLTLNPLRVFSLLVRSVTIPG